MAAADCGRSLPQLRREIEANNRIDYALWENWRGAGFDTATIVPAPLGRGTCNVFPIYELIRPAFELTRLSHRRWSRRRDPAALAQQNKR